MIRGEIESQNIVTPDQPGPNTATQRMNMDQHGANTNLTPVPQQQHHGTSRNDPDHPDQLRTVTDPTRTAPDPTGHVRSPGIAHDQHGATTDLLGANTDRPGLPRIGKTSRMVPDDHGNYKQFKNA